MKDLLKEIVFMILFISLYSKAYSQDINTAFDNKSRTQVYNEAKICFKNKQYEEAKILLEHLIDPSIYQEHVSKNDDAKDNTIPEYIKDEITPYALLYYALVLQDMQEKNQAVHILEYLAREYREWSHYPDILYWLVYINFDIGDYLKATTILNEILGAKNIYKIYNTESIKLNKVPESLYETLIQLIKIKEYHLTKMESPLWLEKILDKYPDDRLARKILTKRLARDPKIDLNNPWTKNVIEKFNLNVHKYSINSYLHSQKKGEYKVAILLPFFLNKIEANTNRSSLIFNLYKGINLAKEVLCEEGKPINIYAYDTKKDINCLKEILNLDELKSMDLIVGPLFPQLVQYTADFAKEYQINMLNPLSYNDDMLKNNPFFYLFMPSDETQALKAAEYVSMLYNEDCAKVNVMGLRQEKLKEIAIIYDNKPDSKRRAEAFKKYIKIYTNVDVKIYMGLDNVQAAQLLSGFRKINKKDKTPKQLMEEEAKRRLFNNVKYLYVASNDPLVFGSIFAIVEMLKLTPTIVGHKKWIEAKTFDIEEFQRKKVVMVDPEYIDLESDALKKFRIRYYIRYNELPDMFSYIGYDSMYFFGNMLHRYGTYFQTVWSKDQGTDVGAALDLLSDKEKVDIEPKRENNGQIFANVRYGRYQNNQSVEMVFLKKGKILKKQVQKLHPYLYVDADI